MVLSLSTSIVPANMVVPYLALTIIKEILKSTYPLYRLSIEVNFPGYRMLLVVADLYFVQFRERYHVLTLSDKLD